MLPVRISGTDAAGRAFFGVAHTLDYNYGGARLGGVHALVQVGAPILIQHHHRKARFEVVWVKHVRSTNEFHVGVRCLELQKDVWNLEANGQALWNHVESDPFVLRGERGRSRGQPERRQNPRFSVEGGAEVSVLGALDGQWTTLTDISRTGCYCQTAKPLPMLTRVRVNMRVGETEAAVVGVVRTSHPEMGMGIEFVQFISDGDEERFKKFLATVESLQAAAPPALRKPDAAFIAAQMAKAADNLRDIEDLLLCTDVDPSVLQDFREALGHVRTTAWAVQRYLETKARQDDTVPVLTYLNQERVRVATQLCRNLTADVTATAPEHLQPAFEELLTAVELLFTELSKHRTTIMAETTDAGSFPDVVIQE